uniref:TSA: Wollemia nobilis Ref_Wollemi_Transcript_12577_1809 transcribed RNA sequence n=1 Tax=Wollemia nobilis TaxID=56998 RepID=A0A0C9S5P2_9CONI
MGFTREAVVIHVVLLLLCLLAGVEGWRPWASNFNLTATGKTANVSSDVKNEFGVSKRYEGSSEFVHMRYHNGPVLTSNITVHTIWYGNWNPIDKRIIRDFLLSISSSGKSPSVGGWWKTVQLYTDQTGSNISRNVVLGSQINDRYSHGKALTRLSIQEVIKSAVTARHNALPIDPKNGLYLLLTSSDVAVQDFCRAVCGFHYFTFPSIVGYTLPYAWIGHSGTQCPDVCAYPFSVPSYMTGMKPFKSPNNNVGVDGMISVIGHEIAELASNPLVNAWYAGQDPSAPTEIADLCEGIYGSGGGGSYTGQVLQDRTGSHYNLNGLRRKYLVQWIWSPVLSACFGPNALDQ